MFTPTESDFIVNYKYHGGDLSPIYKNFLSPLAENCVNTFIPVWMAPNIITFLGLVFSFLAFTLTMIYNPTLEAGGPRWLHLLTGICIFAYQTLDNMDGKQARKTGSSSALGMFFDHACDAINAGITVIAMGSVFGTGWTGKIFTCYGSSFIPFFFQTWEEYYTGSMLLPPFNGPTEGLLLAVGICIIAFFVGSETFHTGVVEVSPDWLPPDNIVLQTVGYPTKSTNALTPYMISLLITSTATFPTMFLHLFRVAQHLLSTKKSWLDIIAAMANVLPFVLFFVAMAVYVVNSTLAYPAFPVVTVLMYCGSFAQLVMYIMVCHILHQPLSCYTHTSIWLTVGLCAYQQYGVYFPVDHERWLQGEVAMLLTFSAYAIISMVSYFQAICSEFADVLHIHVFQLGKKEDKHHRE